MDRFAQFAVSASSQALQDAQFVINELNAEQVGVMALNWWHQGVRRAANGLPESVRIVVAFMVPMMINMAAGLGAIHTVRRDQPLAQ